MDQEGSASLSIPVPTEARAVYFHTPTCNHVCVDVKDPYLTSRSGTVLFLKDLDTGITLLPGFGAADLPTILQLTVGETFMVVDGVAAELPMATIRAPGLQFDEVTDEQWADTESAFPLFTGTAIVEEVVRIQLIVNPNIPALSEWGLVVMVLLFLVLGVGTLFRRRPRRRASNPPDGWSRPCAD